jgi:hypothetical protein
MEWQETLLAKLKRYSGFNLKVEPSGVSVSCRNPDSFRVAIFEEKRGFRVDFDGWHEEFKSVDLALNCFAFGLTKECRLKVVTRRRFDCSWTVQSQRNENWVDDSTVGLFFTPFWQKSRVIYRHNMLID